MELKGNVIKVRFWCNLLFLVINFEGVLAGSKKQIFSKNPYVWFPGSFFLGNFGIFRVFYETKKWFIEKLMFRRKCGPEMDPPMAHFHHFVWKIKKDIFTLIKNFQFGLLSHIQELIFTFKKVLNLSRNELLLSIRIKIQ